LAESNRQLAQRTNEAQLNLGKAQDQRDKALLTQSLFLADLGRQQSEKGNAVSGMLLALEALPDANEGIQRPYSPEAEAALFSSAYSQRERMVLAGHQTHVPIALFCHDGKRIISASGDGTARVWDPATGRQIALLSGHTGTIRAGSIVIDPTL